MDINGQDMGYNSSLAIDGSNVPHISYFNSTHSTLRYANAFGSAWWTRTLPLGPHNGYFSSIDTFNQAIRIGSYDSDNSNLMQASGGDRFGWEYHTILDTFDVGQYLSLKLDGLGRTHISYYDATHGDLVYADWGVHGSYWYTDTRDSTYDVGKFTSLAVSNDNRVYISYFDEEHDHLKMTYQTPPFGIWDTVIVDDGDHNNDGTEEYEVGWRSSIDVDGAGNPYISYYNVTTGDLEFAASPDGGATFNLSTLDDIGLVETVDVGLYSSLKINRTDGTRHICYYDLTNGNLDYARWNSVDGWQFDTIDSDGDVGASCSIDLSVYTAADPGWPPNGQPPIEAGQPAISYYDNSRGDLKIALSYSLPLLRLFLPVIENP